MASSYDVKYSLNGSAGTNLDDEGFVSGDVSRSFTIALSDVGSNDNELTVRVECQRQGLIKREGEVHPNNFLYRCVGVDVRQVSPLFYEGAERYAAQPRPQNEPEDEAAAPWSQPTKLDFSTAKTSEPTDVDANGQPIRNNGTDEPIEGVTRQVSDLVITASKAFLNYQPASNYLFYDKVNSSPFFGFPAGTIKVDDISAKANYHNNQLYHTVTTKFLARRPFLVPASEAWYQRIAVRGFYEVKFALIGQGGTASEVLRAVDGENNPVSTPVYLNKDTGERIPPGSSIQFRTIQIYESTDLNQIGY